MVTATRSRQCQKVEEVYSPVAVAGDESVKHTCHSLCYNLRFCEEGKRMLLQPSKINPLRKLQVHLPETNLSSQKRFMIS